MLLKKKRREAGHSPRVRSSAPSKVLISRAGFEEAHIRFRRMQPDPRPLLKWPGGKWEPYSQIEPFLGEMKDYHEPFVGGGAVFFRLCAAKRFRRAFLTDFNREVIELYEVVRDRPGEVVKLLDEHRERNSEDHYYAVRNVGPLFLAAMSKVSRAARTLYLNKMCFNGLQRQNLKGEFNVSWGKDPTRALYEGSNVLAVSAALKDVELRSCDFEEAMRRARAGDLVFADPPYLENFTNYLRGGFGEREHERLAKTALELASQGVRVVITNSDSPATKEVYPKSKFEHHRIQVRRAINRDGDKRGRVGELVIIAR